MKEKKNTHLPMFLAIGTALAVGTILVIRKQYRTAVDECACQPNTTKASGNFRSLRMEDIEGADSLLNCELGLSCNSNERHCPGLARCGLVECCGFGFDVEDEGREKKEETVLPFEGEMDNSPVPRTKESLETDTVVKNEESSDRNEEV